MTTTNNNPIRHPHGNPSSRHTGFIPEALHDDTSLAKLPEERRLESLPSHDDETRGRLGKSGGIGALPGSANESGVALLPDERVQMGEKPLESSTVNNASTGARSRLDGGGGEEIYLHDSPRTEAREHVLARDEEKIFGSDALRKHQIDSNIAGPSDQGNEDHVEENPIESPRPVGAGSGGSAGAGDVPSTSPKKSGFIHKVKGEMKILSGKISHKESKIEEGRKMAGKN